MTIGFGEGGVGGVSSATVDIGDNVAYSLMLDSGSSQYLTRTFGAPTSDTLWSYSFWIKRGKFTTGSTNQSLLITGSEVNGFYINLTSDNIIVRKASTDAATTTAVFRDPAAWLHLCLISDGTYVKLYRNNIEVASYTGTITGINANGTTYGIGARSTGLAYYDGYLADVIFVDGQALTPSSFGRTSTDTGAWVHKDYAGTYGNNGFRLDFSNSADLGNDVSGNNNDWTTNGGISSANQYTDTPTNNYAVWNPLRFYSTAGAPTLSNGNRTATQNSTTKSTASSLAIPNGQVTHAEFTLSTVNYCRIGIKRANDFNQYTGGWTYLAYAGIIRNTSDTGTQSGLATCTNGDRVTIEVDLVNNTIKFWKNGVALGVAETIANADDWVFYFSQNSSGANDVIVANFGQKTFSDTGGSFSSNGLSTANLPTPAILDTSDHFFAKTRTGTGASYSVTGLNFQPDLVWVKGRSGATDHAIYDAVRGATYQLESNTTTDETTEATGLTAFNADGYSGGALAQMNTNTATYIDWMWNESVTAGLDIVSYTGNGANRTISHGLGVVPKMIIIKSRATAGADTNWAVYHASLANTEYLLLNSTAAKATGATYWNSTTPTSSVFSLGTHADVNTNSDTYIAYCFAEIEGFSKFGSYTGNASTDGVFVYCGFRPRWILTKASSTTGDWRIYDATRPGYNVQGGTLLADTSGTETTTSELDILSNGFKARITTDPNSAQTFIFAAFSELPMKYSTAR